MSDQQRKGTFYPFATIGARTERGGRVASGSGMKVCGLDVACVDDIVTYSDAREAVIMDGAGFAALIEDQPAALVGSLLDNVDMIPDSPHRDPRTVTSFVAIHEHGVALTRQ